MEEFKKKEIPLNMLFNNAGEWMREDNTYTKEGFQVSPGGYHVVMTSEDCVLSCALTMAVSDCRS